MPENDELHFLSDVISSDVRFCQETEELKHDHVSRNFALALQKARNDKGMTQKDFATKV